MGGGMEADLSHGGVAAMWRSAEKGSAGSRAAPVLQVAGVQGANRVVLTDGVHSQPAVLGSTTSHLLAWSRCAIRAGTLVRLLDYVCDAVQDGHRIIIIIKLEILQVECPLIGSFRLYESRRSGGFVARSIALGTRWSSIASWIERSAANNLPHGGSQSDDGNMQVSSNARWAAEPAIFKTVSRIRGEKLGYSEMPDLITVKAYVSHIDTKCYCYPACPLLNVAKRRQCKKLVAREANGTWYCRKCDQVSENCDYRYSARIQIQDATGMVHAHVFEEAGNDIFCHTAKELQLMKSEKRDDYADVMQGVLLNEYVFKLKVKVGTYYDGRRKVFEQKDNSPRRVACTIVKAEKVNTGSGGNITEDGIPGSTSENRIPAGGGARRRSPRRVTFRL